MPYAICERGHVSNYRNTRGTRIADLRCPERTPDGGECGSPIGAAGYVLCPTCTQADIDRIMAENPGSKGFHYHTVSEWVVRHDATHCPGGHPLLRRERRARTLWYPSARIRARKLWGPRGWAGDHYASPYHAEPITTETRYWVGLLAPGEAMESVRAQSAETVVLGTGRTFEAAFENAAKRITENPALLEAKP